MHEGPQRARSPERPLHKDVKGKCHCVGDPKVLEVQELWDICQGELHTGSGTSPKARSVSTPDKDDKIWSLPCWVSVLLWSHISSLCPDSSLMERYMLYHGVLEVCNLLFDFSRACN